MELSHKKSIFENPAIQRLGQFVCDHNKQRHNNNSDLEQYERELHEHMLEIECELLGEEMSRYDVSVEQIEVEGKIYRPTLTSTESYLSGAGLVKVERHLYRPAGRGSKSICPMEMRVGIVAGYFTPRAARQAAFVTAQLTPGESEALFAELEGMRPSRASLDRLPKILSAQWEEHRKKWEASLRAQETVPAEATIMAISVDGVMAPMKVGAEKRKAKQSEPGKHASGPSGNQEVGCGTVVLYNADGERVQTLRYGRMPESKKASLQRQLYAEVASIVALRPDLVRVHLADGAKDNWRLMDEIEQMLSLPSQTCVKILDFYHACEHLKKACDAAWGESTPHSKAQFERLRTLLKEADCGVDLVIRSLKYQRDRARRTKRQCLEAELTYFRNQRSRMNYAEYLRQGLPIASGVMEAACKTLVTQRMKRSGMAWAEAGGQGILTLRSLIQSNRWSSAWTLLRTGFCKQVVELKPPTKISQPANSSDFRSSLILTESIGFSRLPLAV